MGLRSVNQGSASASCLLADTNAWTGSVSLLCGPWKVCVYHYTGFRRHLLGLQSCKLCNSAGCGCEQAGVTQNLTMHC